VAKKNAIKPLELHDKRHLEAAQGWFELGNCIEATEELEQITPKLRGQAARGKIDYVAVAPSGCYGIEAKTLSERRGAKAKTARSEMSESEEIESVSH